MGANPVRVTDNTIDFFILTFLESIKNILVLFCHSFRIHWDKINWYTLNKLLSFNIKSINPIQMHPHIIELYACILKLFVVIFLLAMNFLLSFRNMLIYKTMEVVTSFDASIYKAIQRVLIDSYS